MIKGLVVITFCTMIIGTVFCMKCYNDVREHTEMMHSEQKSYLEEQNKMLKEGLQKGIVVVQQFGETTIIDGERQ